MIIIKYSSLFLFALLIFLVFSVYMHEQAHVQIYKTYGIDSRVEYFKYLPEAKFKTEVDIDDYNKLCLDNCKLAHNQNDILFYNLQALMGILGIGILAILLRMEKIQDKIKK